MVALGVKVVHGSDGIVAAKEPAIKDKVVRAYLIVVWSVVDVFI